MKTETQATQQDHSNIDHALDPLPQNDDDHFDSSEVATGEEETSELEHPQTVNRNINANSTSPPTFKISYWEHVALMITPGLTGVGALIAIGISTYDLYDHLSLKEIMNMISHIFWLGSSINGVSYGGYKLYKTYDQIVKRKDNA